MKKFSCYLFDADGTLFDTTELICQCFLNTARVAGKPDIDKSSIMKSIGLTLREQMEIHFGLLTDERFKMLRDVHMNYQSSIYKNYLRLCTGVLEALQKIKTAGCRSAVVTNRMRPSLETYLNETGIIGYFDYLVTPEETERHKPDPQPAFKAMELLGGSPQESIFIGDATFDIECGHAAGTFTAFVNWSINNPCSLRIKPDYYLDDMRDLCV